MQILDEKTVVGTFGRVLTRADLPRGKPRRWTARLKSDVVDAVNGKLITLEEAKHTYNLSDEEWACWQKRRAEYGPDGLKITKVQKLR